MISDARPTSRMQHVTTTGVALAGALLPLAVGMLLARSVGADPMAPVNALITSGGQRARLDRCQLRGLRPTREGRGELSGRTRPVFTRRPLPGAARRARTVAPGAGRRTWGQPRNEAGR
ncbi:hypothetical protein ACFUMI_31955 [Streptomyces sp. NPDC057273]|uniref:hypothetical protein n=1 Tax=unclassified Streptomyces TaxID=2593676 RepID=UPI00363BA76A